MRSHRLPFRTGGLVLLQERVPLREHRTNGVVQNVDRKLGEAVVALPLLPSDRRALASKYLPSGREEIVKRAERFAENPFIFLQRLSRDPGRQFDVHLPCGRRLPLVGFPSPTQRDWAEVQPDIDRGQTHDLPTIY